MKRVVPPSQPISHRDSNQTICLFNGNTNKVNAQANGSILKQWKRKHTINTLTIENEILDHLDTSGSTINQ